MKGKRKNLIMLACCLMVVSLLLPGCAALGLKKKPKVAIGQPPVPTGPVGQKIGELQTLNLDIKMKKDINKYNAEIQKGQLVSDLIEKEGLFPKCFAVKRIPWGAKMLVYTATEGKDEFYRREANDPNGSYFIEFHCAKLDEEVMGQLFAMQNVRGQKVLLDVPRTVIKGAIGVQGVIEFSKKELQNEWRERLSPVQEPNSTYVKYKEVYLKPLVNETAGSIHAASFYGAYDVPAYMPSQGFRKPEGIEICNGKLFIKDTRYLRFTGRELKFMVPSPVKKEDATEKQQQTTDDDAGGGC